MGTLRDVLYEEVTNPTCQFYVAGRSCGKPAAIFERRALCPDHIEVVRARRARKS